MACSTLWPVVQLWGFVSWRMAEAQPRPNKQWLHAIRAMQSCYHKAAHVGDAMMRRQPACVHPQRARHAITGYALSTDHIVKAASAVVVRKPAADDDERGGRIREPSRSAMATSGCTHRRQTLVAGAVLLGAGMLQPGRAAADGTIAQEGGPQILDGVLTLGDGPASTTAESSSATDPPPPATFSYNWNASVPSNFKASEYARIIRANRPGCWQRIALLIQAGDYQTLGEELGMGPMAELRAASLYLPWALMQSGQYPAATDARKAFLDLDSHVEDMRTAAEAISSGNGGDPQRVQQAFFLMSASLDRCGACWWSNEMLYGECVFWRCLGWRMIIASTRVVLHSHAAFWPPSQPTFSTAPRDHVHPVSYDRAAPMLRHPSKLVVYVQAQSVSCASVPVVPDLVPQV